MDLLEIEVKLKEKVGEKLFKRAQLISENKFGHRTNLIEKYYKSILDGYLDINDEWSDEYIIELIAHKFKTSPNKEALLNEIISTYDMKDDKTRMVLEKYLRAIKNHKI